MQVSYNLKDCQIYRIYIFKWMEGVAFKFHTTQLCLDGRCKWPLLDVAEHADVLLDGVPYT